MSDFIPTDGKPVIGRLCDPRIQKDLQAAMTNIKAVGDSPDGFAIIVDDGCSLPQSELLGLMRLGLSEGETVSEFPDEGRAPVPTNRGLLLLAVAPNLLIQDGMNEATENEEEACPKARGDSRDPNFEPGHDWQYLGEAEDGTSFHQCRNCRLSYES